jgi:hypothetical protein
MLQIPLNLSFCYFALEELSSRIFVRNDSPAWVFVNVLKRGHVHLLVDCLPLVIMYKFFIFTTHGENLCAISMISKSESIL